MSATVSPLITDWISKGLDWQYIFQPALKPEILQPNQMKQIPLDTSIYKYPEGVILLIGAYFDHPNCGIRFESVDPVNIDLKNQFTISVTAAYGMYGTSKSDFVYAKVPPQTLPGIYGLISSKEWPWKKTLRLYVFNADTVPHRFLTAGYTLAVLKSAEENMRVRMRELTEKALETAVLKKEGVFILS